MEAQTVARDRTAAPGERFADAVAYALEVHADQRRPGTNNAYSSHLLRVAGLVIEDGGSEEEGIAALLHDAVEDQGGLARLYDIRGRFGPGVAEIVDELTDAYEDPKPPWRARKERYVLHLAESSPAALRVSLADKLDNVRSLARDYRIHGEDLWPRAGKSRDDVRWYYGTLAHEFAELRPGAVSEEFKDAVRDLDRLVGS
jgi:(p)ppGpp synthase/HD superfamily hydrolase